jgi:hypothetical protein
MSPGYGGHQSTTPPPYLHNDNIRKNRLLHWGTRLLHHQGSRVLHRSWCCPELQHQTYYTEAPKYLNHQVTGVLHVCCPSLLHRGSQVLPSS